jgi:hypothetical protein
MDNNELESRQLISLANNARQRQDWPEVVRLSDEAASVKGIPPDIAGIARYLSASGNSALGATDAAQRACTLGLTIDPLPPPLRFALLRFRAILSERVGNLTAAITDLNEALECTGVGDREFAAGLGLREEIQKRLSCDKSSED